MKLLPKRQKLDKKNLLNIRIVLDRSGSMRGSEKVTIDALNTYLSDIKETGVKGLITLNTFDSISIDTPINEVHIDDLQAFSLNLLEPRGSTPLFDAIGLAIYSLQNIDTFSDDKKVLVIVTDGQENSSREYNYANISEMIKEKEESGWLIIYLGADHDVFKQAKSLNFSQERIMKYSKKDSVDTFKAVSRTTRDYSRGTGNKSISFTEEERRKSDK